MFDEVVLVVVLLVGGGGVAGLFLWWMVMVVLVVVLVVIQVLHLDAMLKRPSVTMPKAVPSPCTQEFLLPPTHLSALFRVGRFASRSRAVASSTEGP